MGMEFAVFLQIHKKGCTRLAAASDKTYQLIKPALSLPDAKTIKGIV
jgi:hypothetical protein